MTVDMHAMYLSQNSGKHEVQPIYILVISIVLPVIFTFCICTVTVIAGVYCYKRRRQETQRLLGNEN